MSDLIIKPSGTGASLKIQNPSGTNKIVMNSSGTITTGTLGSGVTFPAGHVLQVVQNENTETNSLTTSYVNLYEVSITLKSASSDVYGFFYFQYRMETSAGYGIKIYRNHENRMTNSYFKNYIYETKVRLFFISDIFLLLLGLILGFLKSTLRFIILDLLKNLLKLKR